MSFRLLVRSGDLHHHSNKNKHAVTLVKRLQLQRFGHKKLVVEVWVKISMSSYVTSHPPRHKSGLDGV